jgi:hypothetical protein
MASCDFNHNNYIYTSLCCFVRITFCIRINHIEVMPQSRTIYLLAHNDLVLLYKKILMKTWH